MMPPLMTVGSSPAASSSVATSDVVKAAIPALASLAKEDVPDSVLRAYSVDRIEFGREYIIPTPFDPRVLIWEASAVAQAAMETGVARRPVDLGQYKGHVVLVVNVRRALPHEPGDLVFQPCLQHQAAVTGRDGLGHGKLVDLAADILDAADAPVAG